MFLCGSVKAAYMCIYLFVCWGTCKEGSQNVLPDGVGGGGNFLLTVVTESRPGANTGLGMSEKMLIQQRI